MKKLTTLQKKVKLLIRRAKYNVKNNNVDISIEQFKNIKSTKQLISKTNVLNKQIKIAKSSTLSSDIKDFVKEVREYNATLSLKERSKRIYLMPHNAKELKQYREIFKTVKSEDEEKIKSLLNMSDDDTIRSSTLKLDTLNSKKKEYFTYRDNIFLQTSMKSASESDFEELEDLFKIGGESLVIDLSRNQFTIIEYGDSFKVGETFQRDMIISKLRAVSKRLTQRNKEIVEKFLEKY